MAVKIRLTRVGRHKRPLYRIVVTDSQSPRDGRFIEIVGNYDPILKKSHLDETNLVKWLKEGAVVTPTVKTILNRSEWYKKTKSTSASE